MSNILMCGNEPLGLLQGNASDISFDNSGGGLLSDNVQDAIEELDGKIDSKVSKSGDEINGILTINRLGHASRLYMGNNIPSGTTDSSRGLIKLYSNSQYSTDIDNTASLTSNRTITLPDKSGVMALTSDIPDINTITLGHNLYFPNASTWENYVTLSESIDNFRYIGFSWSGADNGGLAGLVDVFIDTGSFKQLIVNSPLALIKDEYSPTDSRSLLIAYHDTTHIRVYRGSEVYQYHRLNIVGICRK